MTIDYKNKYLKYKKKYLKLKGGTNWITRFFNKHDPMLLTPSIIDMSAQEHQAAEGLRREERQLLIEERQREGDQKTERETEREIRRATYPLGSNPDGDNPYGPH